MQPVLNVEDIKRVEIALTRVGVSVSELMHPCRLRCCSRGPWHGRGHL